MGQGEAEVKPCGHGNLMELLTKEIRSKLPPLGSTNEYALKDIIAWAKFFTPDAGWTWFAAEFDGEDIFWGLVIGVAKEYGSFSLSELQSIRGKLGLPVERDLYFTPTPLAELDEKYPDPMFY
jgi:hypothetical protein